MIDRDPYIPRPIVNDLLERVRQQRQASDVDRLKALEIKLGMLLAGWAAKKLSAEEEADARALMVLVKNLRERLESADQENQCDFETYWLIQTVKAFRRRVCPREEAQRPVKLKRYPQTPQVV